MLALKEHPFAKCYVPDSSQLLNSKSPAHLFGFGTTWCDPRLDLLSLPFSQIHTSRWIRLKTRFLNRSWLGLLVPYKLAFREPQVGSIS